MWQVSLTGLISVFAPGSLVQVIAATTLSLGFLVMHARCWPFKDNDKNLLKLGAHRKLLMTMMLVSAPLLAYVNLDLLQPY